MAAIPDRWNPRLWLRAAMLATRRWLLKDTPTEAAARRAADEAWLERVRIEFTRPPFGSLLKRVSAASLLAEETGESFCVVGGHHQAEPADAAVAQPEPESSAGEGSNNE